MGQNLQNKKSEANRVIFFKETSDKKRNDKWEKYDARGSNQAGSQ